ncbi:MAG: hypothetical protein JWN86_3036, partial [Planctomycetota bacterium]|nr:hypothetical protein [Planctomycetota bacterium]
RFHAPAAINDLLSDEADSAADAVNSSCTLIEFRLDHEPAEIALVGSIIREGILGILENVDRYESEMYGDVAPRYRVLLSRPEA